VRSGTYKERKIRHRDVSDSAISECIIFVYSVTDRTEQGNRGKYCAHTSQREKDCAPTKKKFKFGLLTHLGESRGWREGPSQSTSHTFEPSPDLVSKPSITEVNKQVPFSESAHSRHPDLLEDSDNAGVHDVELTLQSLLHQLERHHNITKDLDVRPIEVREVVDFRCDEVAVRGVALIVQGLDVQHEGIKQGQE